MLDKFLDYIMVGCEVLAVLLLIYGIYAAITGADRNSEDIDKEFDDDQY